MLHYLNPADGRVRLLVVNAALDRLLFDAEGNFNAVSKYETPFMSLAGKTIGADFRLPFKLALKKAFFGECLLWNTTYQ